MIISVKKDEINLDNKLIQLKDLNSRLLERIVDSLLKGECTITFEKDDSPLVEFFKNLQKETSATSNLRKQILVLQAERNKLNNELQDLDLSYEGQKLEMSD